MFAKFLISYKFLVCRVDRKVHNSECCSLCTGAGFAQHELCWETVEAITLNCLGR